MEERNRVGIILLIMAGFVLVLCAGMVIGGAVVYGVLRIGDHVSFRAEQEEPEVWREESYEEFSLRMVASGALVTQVLPGTPAEDAGLQVGERILTVDSQQVGPDGALTQLVGQYEPGDRITLEVQAMDGSTRKVRVTLGENPQAQGEPFLGVYTVPTAMRARRLREMLPFSEERVWQLDEVPVPGALGMGSIVVTSVTEGSPAADAGLKHGDMITSLDGEPLHSAMALTEAIAAYEPGDWVTLGIVRVGEDAEAQLRIRLGEHPNQAGKAYLGVTLTDFMRHLRFRGNIGGAEEVPTPPLP